MNNQDNQSAVAVKANTMPGRTKLVELIGPPGVGKSTLYKSLCSSCNSSSNWIHPGWLFTKKSGDKPASFLKYRLLELMGKTSKTRPVDAGLRFANTHKELLSFLWNHIDSPDVYADDETGKKFRSAYFLFRDFSNYQSIWDANSPVPCLIDEGLLSKSFMIADSREAMAELADEYLSLLPLPHAVIYMQTDHVDAITERLLGRKKVIASHAGLDRLAIKTDLLKWNSYFEIVTSKLRQLDVPVYNIDALSPVAANTRIVNDLFTNGII